MCELVNLRLQDILLESQLLSGTRRGKGSVKICEFLFFLNQRLLIFFAGIPSWK